MKQLQSSVENTWIQINNVALTDEQKTTLSNISPEKKDERKAIQLEIKALREGIASDSDVVIAQNLYASNKPKLKETDKYELIAVNISIDGSTGTGIINCRINGEHKQIRF